MGRDCFNCAGPASRTYTIVLEGTRVLEDKPLCSPCRRSLEEREWIEVRSGPWAE